jgi:tetratricopeptide (TPR) repeat protein
MHNKYWTFQLLWLLNLPTLKASIKNILLPIFSVLLIVSCSRKKDNFVSKNYHAVTAEFNALYNGNVALEQGKKALIDSYFDNYWEILPIERMETSDDIQLPGQSKNADFERAEEKAVVAVQKHGMNIQGKEKNPQIDEAYLLLGKARYFDQRFVPALEAFNYILFKYPASDKINQAKVWREKANIRMENNELAIKNLKRLLEEEVIVKQDLADATSILAQAYLNTKSLDSALAQIRIASNATRNNDEKGRYNFIEGQIYNALGHKDSANIAFQEVIDLNRKIPRIYHINAHIERAKNFDLETGDKLVFLAHLTDLEEDRENRPYLDKIYHQIAEYHLQNESDSLAITYYNKSLRERSQDKYMKAKNYETLAEIHFDNTEYSIAGAFYDSTMLNQVRDSKPYRVVKRKRENLDDVIYYEEVAMRNDSIIRLVNLTEADRLVFFTNYTDDLKQKAQEEKEKLEAQEALKNNGLVQVNDKFNKAGGPPGTKRGGPKGALFYFYNPTIVSYGKNEFIKIWGDRSLEDNWRLSNKRTSKIENANVIDDLALASKEELFDPKFYISKIPTEKKVIDSISKDRNFAYYQLGLIYKEKFKEYNLAKDKLQELLKSNPEERLVLPSKYNLFKIYELLGQTEEAEIAKNDIIKNHPDSRYAAILLNPESVTKDENSPEAIYENIYKQFQEQNYTNVISQAEKYILAYEGESIVPKFEFLKASAKARLFGYESYKEAINFIALNYPNSPEGKRAEEMMQTVMPLLANKEFVDNNSTSNFKVLFEFKNASETDIKNFIEPLTKAASRVNHFNLTTSIDIYNEDTKFVVVHGLKSIDGARGFTEFLKESKHNISKPYIAISSPNYKVIQIHKNLQEYLESQ